MSKIDTPICDALASDGWSGDALLVPLEVSKRLEYERDQLIKMVGVGIQFTRLVVWVHRGTEARGVPYHKCVLCNRTWLMANPENENHDEGCIVPRHKAVLATITKNDYKKFK